MDRVWSRIEIAALAIGQIEGPRTIECCWRRVDREIPFVSRVISTLAARYLSREVGRKTDEKFGNCATKRRVVVTPLR